MQRFRRWWRYQTFLAVLGAMLADDTRAEILCTLMDGRAHTGGELARHIGISASTISEHLSNFKMDTWFRLSPKAATDTSD